MHLTRCENIDSYTLIYIYSASLKAEAIVEEGTSTVKEVTTETAKIKAAFVKKSNKPKKIKKSKKSKKSIVVEESQAAAVEMAQVRPIITEEEFDKLSSEEKTKIFKNSNFAMPLYIRNWWRSFK